MTAMVDASLVVCVGVAIALVVFLWFSLPWITRTPARPSTVPVAPGAVPILHHTVELLRNTPTMHDWISSLCDHFEQKPFRVKALGQELKTVVNTPELFEDVLKTQFDVFDKGLYMCDTLHDLLGNGIFAVDGVEWMHQRKTASNLFTMRTLRDSMAHTVQDLMPVIDRIFQRAVDSREPIDLVRLFNRFTMEGFSKIGFGIDLNCLESEQEHPFMAAFDSAQRIIALRFVLPRFVWKILRWLNAGGEQELKRNIEVIDNTVLGIISQSLQRRQQSTPNDPVSHAKGKDIVSLFLDDVSHNDKHEHEPFDPVLLRDIVVNFLIAGRDTTAQALSWFFYELNENPHVENRIRAEIRTVLPQLFQRNAAPPSMEEVQKLTYLEAALKETLRLHPSVPTNFKRANRDTALVDGTFIAKGSAVAISSYCLGRAEHVWGPDAKKFRPERWIDPANPNKLVTVSAFQFNSFHAGPRMCLGMNLAMMEMKIFIASVLSKFHMAVLPGQQTTYDLSLTLPMKGEFLARVEKIEV